MLRPTNNKYLHVMAGNILHQHQRITLQRIYHVLDAVTNFQRKTPSCTDLHR